MKTNSYNRGMTLVEIAIVLVIIGIVITLGAALVGPLTKRAKINDTKEIVNADVESVIGFAASNRRLPSPIYSGIPLHSEFTDNVRNPNDSWTKPLYYIIDTNPSTTLSVIPTGSSDAICGRKTTNYTICRDAACTTATNIQNVAFIVASGAENFNLQTGILTGGVCPAGQTCVRVYDIDTANIDNCTTAANCPNYPVALLITRLEAYDDIVKWVTLDELRTKIGCQGAQLKILNNELPPGTVGSPYPSAAVGATLPFSVDGGATPGTFRWCIEAATTTPLPIGLTFNPVMTGAIRTPPTNSCNGTTPLAETSWIPSPTLSISGTPSSGPPSTSGAYNFTVYVRDNNDLTGTNDNITQKSFVITINPS